ncbi:SpoIID/LytB domain-containing protein [Bacillus sp. NEB1478]|uniref:SpoIID/LytB domain-containing protein n=1 Tax=Bacillus sp. NEB1478 TaxID=3073816 RepID=UPI00287373B0|nr:SpoIID/LytB domain-containing protein [Bacillus sp. NEB1478]WNB92514.1 SpoIID/LytB domain-containing protein [Bacillus sp. NEB1478]
MRKWSIGFIAVLLVFSSILFTKPNTANAADTNVSVLLKEDIQNVSSLSFISKGSFKESVSGRTLTSDKKYTVKLLKGELHLYDGSKFITKGKELTVQPSSVSISHVTTLLGKVERTYLGTMKFSIEAATYIRPINILPVEEYVKGVVPGEMGSAFKLHALRAQAIAARTYVMYALSLKRSVNDTASFQRYVGYSKYYNDSIKAAYETRGKVLTYNGKLIESLFSSSNGGFTETNVGAWPAVGAVKLPYFPAKADTYDPKKVSSSKFYKTQITLTGLDLKNPELWWDSVKERDTKLTDELKKRFLTAGQSAKIVSINSFTLSKERTSGKRIKQADFNITYFAKDSSGNVIADSNNSVKRLYKKVTLNADQIKYALSLKSKYVSAVKTTTTDYQLTILGYGHGVGLSQYGAQSMASKGLGFRDILKFYYPGTVIQNDKITTIPTTPLQVTGTINYEGVNIRKTATTDSASLTKGKLNQSLTILGKTGEWFKVKIGSYTGYVVEDYVNVKETISYKNGITPITSGKVQSLGASIIRDGSTLYVPISGLTKRYNMKYTYYWSSQSFAIVDGARKVSASLTNNTATVNGKKITLSVRPKMINKNVYVPVTFLKQTGLTSYYEEKAEGVLWINK